MTRALPLLKPIRGRRAGPGHPESGKRLWANLDAIPPLRQEPGKHCESGFSRGSQNLTYAVEMCPEKPQYVELIGMRE